MWDYYKKLTNIEGDYFLKDFSRISIIDHSNCDVIEVKNYKTKKSSALKIFNSEKFEDFKIELSFYKQITHNNIVDFHGYFIGQDNASNKTGFIFMELGQENLEKLILRRKKLNIHFTENEIKIFLKNMLEIFCFLENKRTSHGDIKPENIIIIEKDKIKTSKICDVGCQSFTLKNETTKTRNIVGTVPFFSPEIIFEYFEKKDQVIHNPYKKDVFALGLTFLYAITFKVLFHY